MSRRTLLERIDDGINPIVVKELRQAVRSKLVVAALFVFLVLQLGFLAVYLLSRAGRHGGLDADMQAGREAFTFLQAILLGTCLLIPGYAGFRLGYEHSDTNVDLLFISTLRPRAIVSGKLLSALILVLLVYSACAPFMTFTYLLRGLDIPTILFLLLIDFLITLVAIQFCLFLAVLPVPKPVKGALGLGTLLLLIFTFVGMLELTHDLLRDGLFHRGVGTWEFWGPIIGLVVVALSVTGLFFVWSVALLSPASSNRALIVRSYLVFFWLVTGGVMYWLSSLVGFAAPLCIWVFVSAVLFCLQILISINERESWGVRVARTIPRRWWLRLPAFLLYSGSAGGVLFGVLFLGLTIVVGSVALESNLTWREGEMLVEFNRFTLELGLYTVAYCLSAVCLRHYLLRGHFRAQFTWVAALLLLGLGSVLPYMIAYFFYPDALKYGNLEKEWLVTSPFEHLEIDDRNLRHHLHGHMMGGMLPHWSMMFNVMPQLVLTIWAFGAGALAMPWAVAQMMRFKPARRDGTAPDRRVPVEPIEMTTNVLADALPLPAEGNGERIAVEGSEHVSASPPAPGPVSPPGSFLPPSGEAR